MQDINLINVLHFFQISVMKLFFLFLLFFAIRSQCVQASDRNGSNVVADSLPHWNHAYHQTLVMKLLLSVPDGQGGSIVYCDLDKALSLIKQVDRITLEAPKIIYLVGWQYNGHDDKYPAFFEVNKALKRSQDSTARQSLTWMMYEARRYHTTVSLHINMTDAYEDSPLWKEYVDNDLISKNADGSLMVIGNYNHRKAYQINYRNEWERGYAQKRIDSLISVLPLLRTAATIHLDAWIPRESKGHAESVVIESEYQKKVCHYWLQKGIDPTSEWVMDYMTGLVPFAWHFNARAQADYLHIPASIYTGSHMNPDLKYSDFGLEFLFGTSMYGENLFPNARNHVDDRSWDSLFTREFYLNFVPYYFLNRLQRLRVEGEKQARTAYFSGNVRVSLFDSTIVEGNRLLRRGNTVCFPALWRNDNSWVAYSDTATDLSFLLPDEWRHVEQVKVFVITKNGLLWERKITLKNRQVNIHLEKGVPLLITISQ